MRYQYTFLGHYFLKGDGTICGVRVVDDAIRSIPRQNDTPQIWTGVDDPSSCTGQ